MLCALQRHWAAHSSKAPFIKADVGVAPSPTGVLVLNKGLGPRPANSVPPPPPPSPVEPEPPAPACDAPTAPCCLEGVQYDACLTNTASGTSLTQYYRATKNRLYVALRWVAA